MIISSPVRNYMNRDTLKKIIPKRYEKYFLDTKYEVEVRFKNFSEFGITENDFIRIRKNLNAELIQSKVEIFDNGLRRVTIDGDKYWEQKINVEKNIFIDEYGLKLSVSTEIEADGTDDDPILVRSRERYTEEFGDYKIELTRVIENRDTKYELEVEYVLNSETEPEDRPIEFLNGVSYAYKILMDTDYIYTIKERTRVYQHVNKILGKKNSKEIDRSLLNDARDLKYPDFVWGGIVGNINTTYRMTYKADGVRKLIYVDKVGIWLVMAPRCTNLIFPFVKGDITGSIEGTLIEGESISKENRIGDRIKSEKYDIWIHDGLAINGFESILNEAHTDRLAKAGLVCQHINTFMRGYPEILSCRIKTFVEIISIGRTEESVDPMGNIVYKEGIFEIIRNHAIAAGYGPDKNSFLDYKNDGFIFMPNKVPYCKLTRNNGETFDQLITVSPSVIKWKPEELLSIDFRIKKRGYFIELHNEKPFVRPEFDGYIEDSEYFRDIPSDTILEFSWNGETFVPVRVREDKIYPNSSKTAENIWRLIQNPISLTTITGNDMKLYRKYHNRVKRWLYGRTIDKNLLRSGVSSGKTLLDLGSGIGGDVSSWKNFDTIIAVEPDLEKKEEFERRIEKIRDKVHLLKAGSQEFGKITKFVKDITGGKVDVISAMFSLTFLWKNKKMFDGLIKTIKQNLKPNGKFIFAVMNGEAVKNFTDNGNNEWVKFNTMSNLSYILRLDGDMVNLDFPGTLTVPSVEPLTRLSDLLFSLKGYSHTFYTLDSERLLPKADFQLSGMYTAGVMVSPPGAARSVKGKISRPVEEKSENSYFLDDDELGHFEGNKFISVKRITTKFAYVRNVINMLIDGIEAYDGEDSHFTKNMTLDRKEGFIHSGEGCFDVRYALANGKIVRNEDWRERI